MNTPSSARTPVVIAGHALVFNNAGVARYTERLARLIARHAPDRAVHLLVPRRGPPAPGVPDPALSGCLVHSVPRWLPAARPLLSQIASSVPLALHARRRFPRATFLVPWDLLPLLAPRNRISVTHDALNIRAASSRGSSLRRTHWHLCQRWAAGCSEWITISEFAREEIMRSCPAIRRRPTVLTNWVDREFTSPVSPDQRRTVRTRYALPERYWLYVGGYARHKNVELLIRAHHRARQRMPLPPLVLAGRVPATATPATCDIRGELQRRQVGPDAVQLIGHVADSDLPALYAGAELFLSASLHEGFGYPPVEAMATGCPVLVADRTSFQEVVTKAACRFDPDDETGLVERFCRVAGTPDDLRCPFPAEFSEAAGARRWLELLDRTESRQVRN